MPKKPARQANRPASRPRKTRGGGGAEMGGGPATSFDLAAQYFSQCPPGNPEPFLPIAHESSAKPKRQCAEFPDDMYAMAAFVRRAPSHWHLATLFETMLRQILQDAKSAPEERRVSALETLAQMADKLRSTPQKKVWPRMAEAFRQAAFQAVWNRPAPKRRRGDTSGNATRSTLYLFTEQTMLAHDEETEWNNRNLPGGGPTRPERYERADEYVKAFLPFAKTAWENGGRESIEALQENFTPDWAKDASENLHPAKARKLLPKLPPAARLWLVLRILGGLSHSDLFQLQWEDVDFRKGIIRLPLKYGDDETQRTAPMDEEMKRWLKPLAQQRGGVITAYGKLRSNVGSAEDRPKRSFGLFKKEIEAIARENLKDWRAAWPP